MTIFDGKEHSTQLDQQLLAVGAKGAEDVLAVIQIGDNSASDKYVTLKKKLCSRLGIECHVYKLAEQLTDEEIFAQITRIVTDPNVHGAIIQLPLPRPSLKSVLNLIPLAKDIDLLSSKSSDRFYSGDFSKKSPVIRALEYFLTQTPIILAKARVTVVGDGPLVGKPVAYYLTSQGAHVTVIANYETGDKLVGDLVILSTGIPNLVRGFDITAGSTVVDFGSAVVADKTVGDLDLSSPLDHLAVVSPSPGGMGPLVVRYLLMNFLGI